MREQTPPDRFIQGEERWASFSGHAYRMRYLYLKAESPSGLPPVVFVHGFLGYSFSWRFNLKEFARTRDVYAIDLLGMGFSDRPLRAAMDFSMPESARRVLDWLRDSGLSRIDLVATSHGGAVAMVMAAIDQSEQRNAIGRLVLVAPANPYSTRGRKRIWLFNTAFGAHMLKLFGGLDLMKDLSLDYMYGDRTKITRATRDGYRCIMVNPASFDYALGVIKTWWRDMDAIKAALPSISDVPTLLLWGDRDRTVPVRTAARLAQDFRNSQLVILPGVGHLPYEEDPENFNREVLAYLDRGISARAGS